MYDGSGQRVQKVTSSGTVTYVYDAFGNLAAEYGATEPGLTAASGTQYLAMDHLGSTRLVMGAQTERHDYLPFGYEVSGGWRTSGLGYGPDTVPQKFTGQIRDNETGLDFFQARYYAPAQGRFLSPDPANAGADPSDPQTWNGYAYAGNNPMTYTDPSGLMAFAGTATGGEICGPVCAGIGAAVDLGIALFGLFETGGSQTASLPAPRMRVMLQPDASADGQWWNAEATDGTDPDGLYDSGSLWNEQLPISRSSGWTLNTGGVYGSGDAGPWVNNATPVDPNSVELHHIFSQAKEFAAIWNEWEIDIGRYLIALPAGVHRLSQFGGIHTGADNWNANWRAYFEKFPNANREQIFRQARSMIKKFRLGLFAGAESVEGMIFIVVNPCLMNPGPQAKACLEGSSGQMM